MVFPWLLGSGLFRVLIQWLFNIWNKLDEPTKKLIVEAVTKAFEDILRAFYRWWKEGEGKL